MCIASNSKTVLQKNTQERIIPKTQKQTLFATHPPPHRHQKKSLPLIKKNTRKHKKKNRKKSITKWPDPPKDKNEEN
jgi:hypothetical protein